MPLEYPYTSSGLLSGSAYPSANVSPTGTQTSSSLAATFITSTVIQPGTYQFTIVVRGTTTGVGGISFALFDSGGNLIANSEGCTNYSTSASLTSTGTVTVPLTVATAQVYYVKVWNSDSSATVTAVSDANGRSSLTWFGYASATATGQSVAYIAATTTATPNLTPANVVIPFNTISSGTISLNTSTNQFTLAAGVTYKLSAQVNIAVSSGAYTVFGWNNVTSGTPGTLIPGGVLGTAAVVSGNTGEPFGVASVIVTPTSAMQVALVTNSAGGGTATLNVAYAEIVQLGSTTASALSPVGGASSTTGGSAGIVPTPIAGQQDYVIHGDGNWSGQTRLPFLAQTLSSSGSLPAIDNYSAINITASAASLIFTIPSPVITTRELSLIISNAGATNSFTVNGTKIAVGAVAEFLWNVSLTTPAWQIVGVSVSSAVLITAVVATGQAVPIVNGVYSFAGTPTGGLPSGVNIGDIAQYNSGTWTPVYTIAGNTCPPTVLVGSSLNTALSYDLSNGIYTLGGGTTGYTKFTTILNNVATTSAYSGVASPGTPVTQWSASYTTQGGQLDIDVNAFVYAVSSGSNLTVYLLRGGSIIYTYTWIPTNPGASIVVPISFRYIDQPVAGTYTYSINVGVNTDVSNTAAANIIVTELINGGGTGVSTLVTGTAVATTNVTAGSVTSSATALTFIPFTLPSAGTWIVSYTVHGAAGATDSTSTGNVGILAGVFSGGSATPGATNGGTLVTNSEIRVFFENVSGGMAIATSATGEILITTTGPANYQVGVWGDVASSQTAISGATGRSSVTWKGYPNQAMAGQIVNYVTASCTTTPTLAVNTVVPFNTINSGNIALVSNQFTLLAGATYQLRAQVYIASASGAYVDFNWNNVTSGTPGTIITGGVQGFAGNIAGNTGESYSYASVVVTPNATMQVALVVSAIGGSPVLAVAGTYAEITQLGSSAITQYTGATATTPGIAGYVPGAPAGSQLKIFLGNGTWGNLAGSILLTSVIQTGGAVPTVNGNYSFAGVPSGGLPSGIAIGDVANLASGVWSTLYTIATGACPSSVLVGASESSAIPYYLNNGIYTLSGGNTGYTKFTALLNNVNPTAAATGIASPGTPVSGWSATYPTYGGQLNLDVNLDVNFTATGSPGVVYLLRDGTVIYTYTIPSTVTPTVYTPVSFRYIDQPSSGSHTYSINLGLNTTVGTTSYGNIIITELVNGGSGGNFGLSAPVTSTLNATNASAGSTYTTVNTASNITVSTPVAASQIITYTAATATITSSSSGITFNTTTGVASVVNAGTYVMKCEVSLQANAANDTLGIMLVKNGTTVLAVSTAFNSTGGVIEFPCNVNWSGNVLSTDTFDVRVYSNSSTAAHVVYAVNWTITGFPTTVMMGQTVSTLNAIAVTTNNITGNATVNTSSAFVTFPGGTVNGAIPFNTTTGIATLPAGTYRLSAYLPSFVSSVYQWVNVTTGAFIGPRWDTTVNSGTNVNDQPPAWELTVTSSTQVALQMVNAVSTTLGFTDANGLRPYSILIEQLGSSAAALLLPMGGATSTSQGTAGLVPVPPAGSQYKALMGSGNWGTVAGTVLLNAVIQAGGTTPTTAGTYSFSGAPSGGLPSGVNLGDIAVLSSGGAWSTTYTIATGTCPPSVLVGTTESVALPYYLTNGIYSLSGLNGYTKYTTILNNIASTGSVTGIPSPGAPVTGWSASYISLGGQLEIDVNVDLQFTASGSSGSVYLLRDSAVIYTYTIPASVTTGIYVPVSFRYIDQPTSGTHTYSINIGTNITVTTAAVANVIVTELVNGGGGNVGVTAPVTATLSATSSNAGINYTAVTTVNNVVLTTPVASSQIVTYTAATATITSSSSGINFNTTTGVASVTNGGIYHINLSYTVQANTDVFGIMLVKNGTTVLGTSNSNSSGAYLVPVNLNWSGNLLSTDTLDVRVFANSAASHNIYSISWTITGYPTTLMTGQTVSYSQVSLSTTTASLTANSNSPVIFDQNISGTIPYNNTTGLWTLSAGVAYRLTATIRQSSGSATDFGWCSGGALLNTHLAAGSIGSANVEQVIDAIYTPTSTTTVYLSPIAGSATPVVGQVSGGTSTAIITQLGSSAAALLLPVGGATSTLQGTAGLVPAPPAGAQNKALLGNGSWGTVAGTVLLTSVIQAGGAVPTVAGNYSFAGVPTGGLPSGVAIGDIANLAGGVWTTLYTIAANNCPSSVLVGASESVALPFYMTNGIYAASSINGYTKYTTILNNIAATGVASGVASPGTAVSGWSASYVTLGGQLEIDVNIDVQFTSAAAPAIVYLLRDGSIIYTYTMTNTGTAGVYVPISFRYIDQPASGTHTYSINIGTNTVVGTGGIANVIVTELVNGGNGGTLSALASGTITSIVNGSSLSGATSMAAVPGSTFTVPGAGVWTITYNCVLTNSAFTDVLVCLYNVTSSSVVPGSITNVDYLTGSGTAVETASATSIVTTTAATTFQLQWASAGGTSTIINSSSTTPGNSAGSSTITYMGYPLAAATGQTVSTSTAYLTGTQSAAANNTVINFNSVTGVVPYSAGVWTLPAGTWALEASVVSYSTSGGDPRPSFSWYNDTTASTIGCQSGLYAPADSASNAGGGGVAKAVITVTSATNVDFRIVFGAGSGGTVTAGDFTGGNDYAAWATVTQLGSSAAAALNPFGGSTASVQGTAGLVPAPPAGSQNKALLGNGSWGTVAGTVLLSAVVQVGQTVPTANGLYSFSGIPSGGLPSGVALGDIAQLTGVTWTTLYTIAAGTCPAAVLVGPTETTALNYQLYNGVYVTNAGITGYSKFTSLFNVSAGSAITGAASPGTPVPAWSATYTTLGGQLKFDANFSVYNFTSAGPIVIYVLRDSSIVYTYNGYLSVSGQFFETSFSFIDQPTSGTHTYSVNIGNGNNVNGNCYGSLLVTELINGGGVVPGYSKFTQLLTNVNPTGTTGAASPGTAVPNWSASYTTLGGQLLLDVNIEVYFSAAASTGNVYLLRDGSVIYSYVWAANSLPAGLFEPLSFRFVDQPSAGAHTYSINLGPNTNTSAGANANLIITEHINGGGTGVSSIYTNSVNSTTQVSSSGTTSAAALTVFGISAPTAGTWGITYTLANTNSSADISQAGLFNLGSSAIPAAGAATGGTLVSGSTVTLSSVQSSIVVSNSICSGTIWVTTTQATNFAVGIWATGNATVVNSAAYTGASSNISIVGYPSQAILGQTITYVSAGLSSTFSTGTNGTNIPLNTIYGGTIPLNTTTGVFTLTAYLTYEISFNVEIQATSTGTGYFAMVDSTTNNLLNNAAVVYIPIPVAATNYTGSATFVYTPTSNQTIVLRLISAPGTDTMGIGTSVTITQLGTSSSAVLNTFGGSTSTAQGTAGLVPAPPAAGNLDYLRADASWQAFAPFTPQKFTASGSYTPSANLKYIIVEGVGGGGAGASVGVISANQISIGGGGAGGGYVKVLITAAQLQAYLTAISSTTVPVVIGGGGTTTAGAGNPGGNTIFGTSGQSIYLVASGGSGGTSIFGSVLNQFFTSNITSGGSQSVTGGTDLGSTSGYIGFAATGSISSTTASILTGKGGDTKMFNGGGSPWSYNSTTLTATGNGGVGGTNTGCGGGGGGIVGTGAAATGGAGGTGFLIIREYFQ